MTSPTSVLIVEDEPTLRNAMVRGLARLPGIEVRDAGSLEEALHLVDAAAPGLVLSDIDLPGRSGIDLLDELAARGLRVPVVYISAHLGSYGPLIPQHADVEVREKPVGLEELRQIVLARVGAARERAEEAEHAPFMVADYLQLACLGRHSVVIEVRGENGAGRIVVAGGDVWSAEDEAGGGVDAFRRLASRAASRR